MSLTIGMLKIMGWKLKKRDPNYLPTLSTIIVSTREFCDKIDKELAEVAKPVKNKKKSLKIKHYICSKGAEYDCAGMGIDNNCVYTLKCPYKRKVS